jgi:hypothetical protein
MFKQKTTALEEKKSRRTGINVKQSRLREINRDIYFHLSNWYNLYCIERRDF